MLFGFFNRTSKILNLLRKSDILNNVPQMCSNKSTILPHRLVKITQVIPKFILNDTNIETETFTPLFAAFENNKVVDNPTKNFYLVFYPDINVIPTSKNTNNQVLLNEYWKNVVPMFLCWDIGGYYLSTSDDNHTISFEVCEKDMCEGFLSQPSGHYDIDKSFGKNILFKDMRIYIRRHIK